jgi:3-oxoacyl-[acyl-carrier-protein] synthase III
MNGTISSVITGTGSYIPSRCLKNSDFIERDFLDAEGRPFDRTNQDIVDKFYGITTISERRYVTDDLVTSDIGYYAAVKGLEAANIDKETLDYIIVAHNFGDVRHDNKQLDMVPSLASRIKHLLAIENPSCVAYDLSFGCPGWLQALIHADYFIKSGNVRNILVIGAETLSRVCDPHDRDSMLYADGAGAVVLQARKSEAPIGILGHKSRSDTLQHSKMLYMGPSYSVNENRKDEMFLKMHGRKLYQYALERVPQAIKDCLDKSNIDLGEVKKILIHQANGKMDEAILKRLFSLYSRQEIPEDIMPMTIDWLGNSSVATIPTLLDLLLRDQLNSHKITRGDLIVFASVGAGMNINALIYKIPEDSTIV